MFTEILSFVLKYKAIIIFYLFLAIFFFIKRKQLVYQAKIIILYRTKLGLKFIEKVSIKFRELIILLGYIGVGAGYVGMIFISYILIKNVYDLLMVPSAASGVALVLPGVNVPGMGILPFWYWILSIFIIALVHEFAHGIVARAHNINIHNTGIVLLGPIIGAFVEPDEKQLRKQKDIKQYSVLAAGPFSNVILALIALVLLMFVFTPLQQGMTESTGFTFDNYVDESLPFAQAGIMPGTLITGIDNQDTLEFQQFSDQLFCTSPGDEILIKTKNQDYKVTLTQNPDNPKKSFLGIQSIHNEYQIKEQYDQGFWKTIYDLIVWINGFLRWLFLLSLGIGLFNLLPLPIVDGGRMLQITMHQLKGEKKGEKRFRQISLFFLLILIVSLIYPFLSGLF